MPTTYDVEPLAGFDDQLGLLMATWADSTREWRENLGEPTPDAVVWQMYPQGPSIGALLLHMADCDAYWLETYAANRARPEGEVEALLSNEIDQDNGVWPVPPSQPIEWYLDVLERTRTRAIEAIRGFTATKRFESEWEIATLRWVVAHLVEHDSYHGGQAVMLHEAWKRLRA